MSDPISADNLGAVHRTGLRSVLVEFFDPPLCCPSGVCGPTIDPVLLDVNEMVLTLQGEGVSVARYQMTSHAQAFVNNREVFRLVREKQLAALPITVVRNLRANKRRDGEFKAISLPFRHDTLFAVRRSQGIAPLVPKRHLSGIGYPFVTVTSFPASHR